MRLGKHAVQHDPRTLRYAAYAASVPTPPDTVNWYSDAGTWRPLGNLQLGNCTATMVAHQVQAMTSADLGTPALVPYRGVMRFYSATSGYVPGRPATDQGATMLSVMNRWRHVGMAGHKINAYAAIDVADLLHIRQAVWLFGGAPIGLQLPLSLKALVLSGGTTWDVQGPVTGDNAAGSWGGHAVPILGYVPDGSGGFNYFAPSWNGLYTITTAFMAAYCDEAYAAFSQRDWSRAGYAPNGFNTAALLADVAAILQTANAA